MLKKKRLKNHLTGLNQTSRAALIAVLLLGFVEAAYPAEATPGRGGLRIAPIRFTVKSGGAVSYSLHRTISDQLSQTSQSAGLSVYSRLNAASYIWQPWFSRVNSELGVDLRNYRSSISGYSSDKSTGVGISGMISLKLVPESRFPFEAKLERRRDSLKSGLSSRESISNGTSLFITQGYKSRNGMTRGTAGFTHTLSDDNSHTKTDKTDAANLSLTHVPRLSHVIQVRANIKRTYRPLLNYRSLLDNLFVDYRVRPNSTTTISNIYNLNKGSYRQGGDTSNYITQQFGTQSSWQSKKIPLAISGSARIYRFGSNSSNKQEGGSNLNFGANYVLSKTMRARASANINDNLSGTQDISTTASITSTKNFTDISNIAGFTYKRYINGSLSNQNRTLSSSGSQSSSNSQSLSLSAGHSLTKRAQAFGNPWISNVNQVISSSTSTSRSTSPGVSLGTSGSSSWSSSSEKTSGGTTSVRVNASDTRFLGSSENFGATQRLGLSVNYTSVLVRNQSLSASLSATSNRKSTSVNAPGTRDFNLDALVTYIHSRVLRVRNLDFRSTLKANYNSQQASDISTQSANMASWDNYLKYHIGALDMSLNVLLTQYRNSKPSADIIFTATRSF